MSDHLYYRIGRISDMSVYVWAPHKALAELAGKILQSHVPGGLFEYVPHAYSEDFVGRKRHREDVIKEIIAEMESGDFSNLSREEIIKQLKSKVEVNP